MDHLKLETSDCTARKALAKWGKTSEHYKRLWNRVQEACSKCKKGFFENKVSGLQYMNISRWWKDIKELGGLSGSGDWCLMKLH